MKANYFCYDSDVFEAAIESYKKSMESLQALKMSTGESIQILKESGWDSEAGKEFFKNYVDEWSPILDNYIDLLNFLISCIEKGKEDFNQLVTEAEALSIDNY